MAWMSAETGTTKYEAARAGALVFAIINIMIIPFVTFMNLIELAVNIKKYMAVCTCEHSPMYMDNSNVYRNIFYYGWAVLFSLITLTFSSLLLYGILKKKPGYIKAYFSYAVIVVGSSMAVLINICVLETCALQGAHFVVIFLYGVTIVILHMIRVAYTKMEAASDLTAQKTKPLNENEMEQQCGKTDEGVLP